MTDWHLPPPTTGLSLFHISSLPLPSRITTSRANILGFYPSLFVALIFARYRLINYIRIYLYIYIYIYIFIYL